MDSGLEPLRELKVLGKSSDTRETLARAKRAVEERGLKDWLIVDVDAHHFETQSWADVVAEITSDDVRQIAESFERK